VVFAVIWIRGADVEPITFALSLCSTFFFSLPALADVIIDRKPISEMSYDEILSFITESDPKKDWKGISADGKEEFFCLHDTRLRIRHHTGDAGVQNDDFKEKWANRFPDPKAYGFWYDIVLNGDCIKRMLLVAVDGLRAYIPCPKPASMTITPLQDKIGQIVAMHDMSYAEYKERIGIKVEA
jgi:hypothetical protein